MMSRVTWLVPRVVFVGAIFVAVYLKNAIAQTEDFYYQGTKYWLSPSLQRFEDATKTCDDNGNLSTPRDTIVLDALGAIFLRPRNITHAWIGARAMWKGFRWIDKQAGKDEAVYVESGLRQSAVQSRRSQCGALVVDSQRERPSSWFLGDCSRAKPFFCRNNLFPRACRGRNGSAGWSAGGGGRVPFVVKGGGARACYTLHRRAVTWATARNACRDDGGILASFDNEEQYKKFTKRVTGMLPADVPSYWIGLVMWEWAWLSGEHILSSGSWGPGAPVSNGDCLTVATLGGEGSKYRWQNANCDLQLPAVCQWSASGSTLPVESTNKYAMDKNDTETDLKKSHARWKQFFALTIFSDMSPSKFVEGGPFLVVGVCVGVVLILIPAVCVCFFLARRQGEKGRCCRARAASRPKDLPYSSLYNNATCNSIVDNGGPHSPGFTLADHHIFPGGPAAHPQPPMHVREGPLPCAPGAQSDPYRDLENTYESPYACSYVGKSQHGTSVYSLDGCTNIRHDTVRHTIGGGSAL